MKKTSVTIGIPACNEEKNIGRLIRDLLRQHAKTLTIKKIIVISDGSTDSTTQMAKKYGSRIVKVIEHKYRKGKALRENEIVSEVKSDVLVILDADVLPKGKDFLETLVEPIVAGRADLVAGNPQPLPATNLIEEIVNFGVRFKSQLFGKGHRNPVYTCNGRVRAFSNTFLHSFKWSPTIGEDAFSYFFCISNGFRYLFNKNAVVNYRSPSSLKDHMRQSTRFLQSRVVMESYFDKDLVRINYKIDTLFIVRIYVENFVHNPLWMFLYGFVFLYSCFVSRTKELAKSAWDVSRSSKKL